MSAPGEPDQNTQQQQPVTPEPSGPGTQATAKPKPARPQPKVLPPWKVLLHNDDVNDCEYVVDTLMQLTPLSEEQATKRMLEAHLTGVSLVLTTHQERAELYQQQFASRGLTVTAEPAE